MTIERGKSTAQGGFRMTVWLVISIGIVVALLCVAGRENGRTRRGRYGSSDGAVLTGGGADCSADGGGGCDGGGGGGD